MMEDIGPEASKRPRLDSFGGAPPMHRMHQQHSESPLPLHTYQGQALRPPSAYSQPLPPSPYDPTHDHRNLPEGPPHAYPSQHSGYNTPVQTSRPYQPDAVYSRQGSHSAPTRSPDEGQPITGLRPINTASGNDGQHYAQHPHPDPSNHPAGPPIAYGASEGYVNGNTHGLPMATPHDPSHRPPPVQQYAGYSESPLGNAPGPYSAGYGPAPQDWRSIQHGQRKNTRALQACDTCRSRKAKCDEGKPVCGYCRDNNQQCRYKEVAPPKADRAQKEIMDQLKALIDGQKVLTERFDRLEARSERPLSRQSLRSGEEIPATTPHGSVSDGGMRNIPLHTSADTPERKLTLVMSDTNMNDADGGDPRSDSQDAPSNVLPAREASYGSVVVDHSNGAHRLLRWPTIKHLLRHRPVGEDYVMEMEERKGFLRLYGRGQGRDLYDGAAAGPASPATSTPSAKGDEMSRSPGSTPPDVWGTTLGPPAIPDPRLATDARTVVPDHAGGLNADGSLKLDWPTMDRLRDSYLRTLHILHPFLNRTRLQRMFQRVYSYSLPADQTLIRSPYVATTALWPDAALNKATKRKHSNVMGIDSPNDTSTASVSRGHKEQPLERRISTAIVLLVMALGKICQHRNPLPGPVPENSKEAGLKDQSLRPDSPLHADSPPLLAVKPSPTTSSVSLPSPRSELRTAITSRRSSTDLYSYPLGYRPDKNVDVVHGLAYFARATEILGNLNGGQDLTYVQACLLASLYASQMACVLESWSWIQNACRACHFLIRDPTLRKEPDPTKADMIRFAYWTCLQFESDILAELDLRRSGIERAEHENVIAYPNGVSEDSTELVGLTTPEGIVMAYYSSQISLRTTLNHIQTILYPPGANHTQVKLAARDECVQMLERWLELLPPPLTWNDDDPPDTDINVARLRAKVYGARYIIHRPFLNYALHSPGLRDSIDRQLTSLRKPQFESPTGREQGAMAPPSRERSERDTEIQEILRSAEQCIDAAIRSTEAFDGVRRQGRLIVTNIFGTAHAQFGNMLVLAATYRSHLGRLVEKNNFLRLLDRTIKFLLELAPISSTLHLDAQILENVRRSVANDEQASSSFSSTYSG